jgi:hypothetical protein
LFSKHQRSGLARHRSVALYASRCRTSAGSIPGECRCLYEAEGDSIRIEYAKSPCVGYPSGWNVPADTVLTIEIRYIEPRNLSELQIVETEFTKAIDDTLTTYYSSRDRGMEYTVGNTISGFKHIATSYFPTTKDAHLRCDCFPALDESTSRSIHWDEFGLVSIDSLPARLDNYSVDLFNRSPELTGYVIIYRGKRTSSKVMLRYRQSITRHLIQTRKLPPERLVILDGGYREDPAFELFMMSRELSPPEPRATWAPCRNSIRRRSGK